jgi:hypothetical protein
MPAKRELTMRQLRYMLRLHHDGMSAREIGRTLGVARSTIQDNLRRAQASGIAWPVPPSFSSSCVESWADSDIDLWSVAGPCRYCRGSPS